MAIVTIASIHNLILQDAFLTVKHYKFLYLICHAKLKKNVSLYTCLIFMFWVNRYKNCNMFSWVKF